MSDKNKEFKTRIIPCVVCDKSIEVIVDYINTLVVRKVEDNANSMTSNRASTYVDYIVVKCPCEKSHTQRVYIKSEER